MVIFIILTTDTCEHDRMVLICTARIWIQSLRTAPCLIRAATSATFRFVVRMNILTCKSTGQSRYKCLTASGTGMHVKTYDTQRVPYHQQSCRHISENILHSNLQRYKILRN